MNNSTDNYKSELESSLPSLETEPIANNKENIPILPPIMFKKDNKNKSLFEPVRALELLAHDNFDDDEENENMIIEQEEVEESGDICIDVDNVNNNIVPGIPQIPQLPQLPETQFQSNESSVSHTNTNNSLSSTGRLLESESEFNNHPKVTYNGNEMIFRALRMKCTHCEEAYTKTHDLYAHIRTHQHHTICPHCSRKLTCMATFVYHVRTHTSEKPYYCPVEGCDFKNAVKYNLKVHLACIRHGGKANLKKYAKVLDLDVCAKSLRKRKDNSVHELGSRRSKKRRKLKLNNCSNTHQRHHNHNHNINNMNNMNSYYPKQEEYDQFAAQLLFSLSGIPPVMDMNQMNHPIVDWSSGISPTNDLIKSEQIQQNECMLKPEQYYDPLYGYYSVNSANQSLSTSASTILEQQQQKLESMHKQSNNNNNGNVNNDNNSDAALIPKQEPIYSNFVTNPPYSTLPSLDIHSNNNHMQYMVPPNIYYLPNMYYDNAHLLYSNPSTNPNQIDINNDDQQNNNKKIEVPPLPVQFIENYNELTGFEVNK